MAVVVTIALLGVMILLCVAVQAMDELLSRFGVISFAHGVSLGVCKIYLCHLIYYQFGYKLSWLAVMAVIATSLASLVIKFRNSGARWVMALNAGDMVGMLAGGLKFT